MAMMFLGIVTKPACSVTNPKGITRPRHGFGCRDRVVDKRTVRLSVECAPMILPRYGNCAARKVSPLHQRPVCA
jgi:hypothetical protein